MRSSPTRPSRHARRIGWVGPGLSMPLMMTSQSTSRLTPAAADGRRDSQRDSGGAAWSAAAGDLRGRSGVRDLPEPGRGRRSNDRRVVGEALARYRADAAITRVEWKTRGHPRARLHDALVSSGFVPDEPESIMIGEARRLAVDVALPARSDYGCHVGTGRPGDVRDAGRGIRRPRRRALVRRGGRAGWRWCWRRWCYGRGVIAGAGASRGMIAAAICRRRRSAP